MLLSGSYYETVCTGNAAFLLAQKRLLVDRYFWYSSWSRKKVGLFVRIQTIQVPFGKCLKYLGNTCNKNFLICPGNFVLGHWSGHASFVDTVNTRKLCQLVFTICNFRKLKKQKLAKRLEYPFYLRKEARICFLLNRVIRFYGVLINVKCL